MSTSMKSTDRALLGAYFALGAQALAPIVIGSFSSLKTPKALRRKLKAKARNHSVLQYDDDDDEDDDDEEEHLTLTDSLWFPVLGSVALLSMFLLLKYVGTEYVNLVIGVYFGFLGIFAVQNSLSVITRYTLRKASFTPQTYHLRISGGIRQILHQPFTLPSLVLFPLAAGLPPVYLYLGKPWYLTNVLGFAFSHGAIEVMKLDSFKTGAALLTGLFFYDIFWVFGTPVMVTVAKGLDAPIKILAPKGFTSTDFALLGLGDIVIPGLMIAMCLRFDYARASKRSDVLPHQSFSKPYFTTILLAYIAGLATTVGVMHTFKAAQPALLYLSPACVGAPVLLALARGEVGELWSWTDGDQVPAEAAIRPCAVAESPDNDSSMDTRPSDTDDKARRRKGKNK